MGTKATKSCSIGAINTTNFFPPYAASASDFELVISDIVRLVVVPEFPPNTWSYAPLGCQQIPSTISYPPGRSKVGIAVLIARANSGNKPPQLIFNRVDQILGQTLAGVVNVLDFEIVFILGGGVEAWRYWSGGFDRAFRFFLVASKREVALRVES